MQPVQHLLMMGLSYKTPFHCFTPLHCLWTILWQVVYKIFKLFLHALQSQLMPNPLYSHTVCSKTLPHYWQHSIY